MGRINLNPKALVTLRTMGVNKAQFALYSSQIHKLRLGMIPGDGIGKEVIPAAKQVLDALPSKYNLRFEYEQLDAGFEHFQANGVALPKETVEALKGCDGGMFGAVSSPSHKVKGYSSPIVALRKEMDLYANVRPVTLPKDPSNVNTNEKKVDMVIVRENTECLYIKDEEQGVDKDGKKYAVARRLITERASQRVGAVALNIALARAQSQTSHHQKSKLTIVHKSNVLSITDGLFRETIREFYEQNEKYHGIQLEEQLVDSMVYKLFRDPSPFDVVVAPNLYGDIISDGAAALVGSLGLVPSANVGDKFIMGEPVHGSAPDIQGQGISNPLAAIRSASLMLSFLGHHESSHAINRAVDLAIIEGKFLTPDLGGKATTQQVTDRVIQNLS